MRKGSYRSSRLFYPTILSVPMDKDQMYFDVINGRRIEVDPGEEYVFSVIADASSHQEDCEPYRAFTQAVDPNGWVSAEGDLEGAWLTVSLPYWYKRPDNPDPAHQNAEPPAVTSIEVWNAWSTNYVCKKFKIYGSYEGITWEYIRECEVKKNDRTKNFMFPLTYGEEEDPIETEDEEPVSNEMTYDQYPRYRHFKIEVVETYGDEHVGFTRIDFRGHVDHNDPIFTTWSDKANGTHEKLFMQNDDNDGIIWEKVHKNQNMIFQAVSWYPGWYSSRNYTVCRFRPKDPNRPYVGRGHSAFAKDIVQRTKDFLISISGTYYYKESAEVQVSNDGIHWTKQTNGVPGTWLNSGYSWSTVENVGHINGWRFEIEDNGKFKWTRINSTSESVYYCGDVHTAGEYTEGNHGWYKFMDAEGNLYTSELSSRYSYIDQSQNPARVVWTSCNWTYAYFNGKYYAYGKFTDLYYWNEVLREWQTLTHFTIAESSDGFKHVTYHKIADPVVGNSFNNVCLYRFNERLLLFEQGSIRNASTGQWESHSKVHDFGNSLGNTPTVKKTKDYITVPLIGYNAEGQYDTTTLIFNGSEPNLARNKNISVGFNQSMFNGTVYVKDGKPSDPYDYLVWSTTYKINSWGSGAADAGGVVVVEGDLTTQPERRKSSFSYDTSNIMIDRDNFTWGSRDR